MDRREAIENVMREKYAELRVRLGAAARTLCKDLKDDDVEDAIQDAFSLLCEQWDKYRGYQNLAGMLYRAGFYNLQKKRREIAGQNTYTVPGEDEAFAFDQASMQAWEEAESETCSFQNRQDMLLKIKNQISAEAYAFLIRYYSDAETAKQIAASYGIKEAAVWKKKERLIRKLGRLIFNKMFTIVLSGSILSATLISEGGMSDGEMPRKTETRPDAPSPNAAYMLSEQDAETILRFLHQLPPDKLEEIDLQLVDICFAVLGGTFSAAPDAGDEVRALRRFTRRIARQKVTRAESGQAPRRISKRMIVALVVIACLLITAAAYALFWLPWLFSVTREGEQYVVNISTGDQAAVVQETTFMETGLNPEFDDLLRKHEMYLPLPTWIPEDLVYDTTDIVSDDTSDTYLLGQFTNGRRIVFIGVQKFHRAETQSTSFLEKDDAVYEELEWHGEQYLLYSNTDKLNIFWHTPPYTCLITGRVSKEDMIRILHSIPERSTP